MPPNKKETLFFHILRGVSRPAEWCFGLLFALAFLYAFCLKMDVPANLLRYVMHKNLPDIHDVQIEQLSGPFPFAFKVGHFSFCSQNHRFTFKKFHGSWSWTGFGFIVYIKKFSLCPLSPSSSASSSPATSILSSSASSPATSPPLPASAANLLGDYSVYYKAIVSNAQYLKYLKYLCFLFVKKINLPDYNDFFQLDIGFVSPNQNWLTWTCPKKQQTLCLRNVQSHGGQYTGSLAFRQKNLSPIEIRTNFQGKDDHVKWTLQTTWGTSKQTAICEGTLIPTKLLEFLEQWKGEFLEPPLSLQVPFLQGKGVFSQGKGNIFTKVLLTTSRFRLDFSSDVPPSSLNQKRKNNKPEQEAKAALPLSSVVPTQAQRSHEGFISAHLLSLQKLAFHLSYGKKTASFEKSSLPFCEIQGTFQKAQISVEKLHGIWGGKPITAQPFQWELEQQKLSPIVVKWGDVSLTTENFIKTKQAEAESSWTLSPISLCFANNTLYLGTLHCQGTLRLQKRQPTVSFQFSLAPEKTAIPKGAKPLKLYVRGEGVLSAEKLSFSSIRVITSRKDQLNMAFHLFPFRPSFQNLWTGIFENPSFSKRSSVSVDGFMKGTLSLAPIRVFLTPGDILAGDVSMDLRFSNELKKPDVSGTFVLKDGIFEHVKQGIVLKNIRLHANGEKNGLKMTAIRLIDGTQKSLQAPSLFSIKSPPPGCAGGSGYFRFFTEAGILLPELDFDLLCHKLQVTYTPKVKARTSGKLFMKGFVTGRALGPMVTGTAVIDALTVEVDEMEASPSEKPAENLIIYEKGKKRVPTLLAGENSLEKAKKPANQMAKFMMNVTLKTGKPIRVQGKNFLCFLKGTLTAKGRIDNGYLVGQLELDPRQKSFYKSLGKELIVNKGVLDYSESHLNEPYAQIVLTTRIGGTDVWATFSGHLSQPEIKLSSHPPLRHEEILSLLLFGHSFNDLSPNQNLQVKAMSSQMLQGKFNFLDQLRHRLGLDSLEVVETQNLTSGEAVQSVRIGKQLKKAKIFLNTNLSTKSSSKMTVRVDLTPELGLEANVSTEKEENGVGFQWVKRY